MTSTFTIIPGYKVRKIVEEEQHNLLNIIQDAYVQYGSHKALNPPSYFLRFPDLERSRIIALPALSIESPRIAGIKWIASNPENINKGLARASAVIILNDYDTGYPIACLEGGLISALRTVYSAVLVTNLLIHDKVVSTLGIIGAGNISKQFFDALLSEKWAIQTIYIFDLNDDQAHVLKHHIETSRPGISVIINDDFEPLIKQSNIIFCATTAPNPYIHCVEWFSHNPIVLNLSLRDFSPDIIIEANNIVDDVNHVMHANTSPHLTQQKYGHTDFINCSVFELIAGYNLFNVNKPIIFSPMGLGVLDLFLAHYIYRHEKSSPSDPDLTIDNFFDEIRNAHLSI